MTSAGGDFMVTLAIDRQLFASEPALRVGAFAATELDRAAARLSGIDVHDHWAAATASLAANGMTRQAAARLPAGIGLLVQRVLANGGVITPIPLISLALATAARHLVSIGAYDIDALPAPAAILRRLRPGDDWFVPLAARPTDAGAGVGVDDVVLAS